jgi:hypothetical protein
MFTLARVKVKVKEVPLRGPKWRTVVSRLVLATLSDLL